MKVVGREAVSVHVPSRQLGVVAFIGEVNNRNWKQTRLHVIASPEGFTSFSTANLLGYLFSSAHFQSPGTEAVHSSSHYISAIGELFNRVKTFEWNQHSVSVTYDFIKVLMNVCWDVFQSLMFYVDTIRIIWKCGKRNTRGHKAWPQAQGQIAAWPLCP